MCIIIGSLWMLFGSCAVWIKMSRCKKQTQMCVCVSMSVIAKVCVLLHMDMCVYPRCQLYSGTCNISLTTTHNNLCSPAREGLCKEADLHCWGFMTNVKQHGQCNGDGKTAICLSPPLPFPLSAWKVHNRQCLHCVARGNRLLDKQWCLCWACILSSTGRKPTQ